MQEFECGEDVLRMRRMTQRGLWGGLTRGEAVIWDSHGAAGCEGQTCGELTVMGLVFAGGDRTSALVTNWSKDSWQGSRSPGAAMDEDDERAACCMLGVVEVEFVRRAGSVRDVEAGLRVHYEEAETQREPTRHLISGARRRRHFLPGPRREGPLYNAASAQLSP